MTTIRMTVSPRVTAAWTSDRECLAPAVISARRIRAAPQKVITHSHAICYLLLCRYINTSAITVDEGFSAERTYILLRTLGLRHLTVVDRLVMCDRRRTPAASASKCSMQMTQVWLYVHRFNRVKGIVTRKDLLGYKLDEAVQVLLANASEGMCSCIHMCCSACEQTACHCARNPAAHMLVCAQGIGADESGLERLRSPLTEPRTV